MRSARLGWLILLALALLTPFVSDSTSQLSRYEAVLITMLVAFGLNLMFGYAGELSIGQPFILGVAAYGAGVLSAVYHFNAFATLPIALGIGVVAGVILNSVSLRVKGWYLAVTTFFAVTVLPDLLGVFDKWTQGSNGLGGISPIPGMNLSITGNSVREYELIVVIAAAGWLVFRNLQTSRWGITLRALRDCRNGLLASGGDLTLIRFAVTVVAALPVALAGWLTAHVNMFLVPDSFGLNQLLLFIGAVLVGGRGTVWGPVIGTVIFEGVNLWIAPFSNVNQLVLGAAVLVIAAAFPVGLVGAWRQLSPAVLDLLSRARRSPRSAKSRLVVRTGSMDRDELVAFAPSAAAKEHEERDVAVVVDGIRKSFGGVLALDDVSLTLFAGQITGLIGPNGSGKTTLLNVITGFVKADEGRVLLAGEDVTGLSPHGMARRGVRRSFQTPQLVGELTAAENVLLGLIGGERQRILSSILRGPGYRRRSKALADRVSRVCRAFGLTDCADVRVEEMPLGLRRIVEIARAVVAGPRVVCLDEPAAGLGDADLRHLHSVLRQLADLGFAVLLIEHNLSFVKSASDTLVSLDFGRVVDEHEVGAVLSQVVTAPSQVSTLPGNYAMVPSTRQIEPAVASANGLQRNPDALLTVSSLSAWYGQAQALFGVSLHINEGEIVGILGANGAGKSTLLRSIARIHRKTTGSISLRSHELLSMQASDVASTGVSLVREGALVFPNLTVLEHLAFARQLTRRRGKEWRGDRQVWEWLPMLYERRNLRAGLLSGGQRQLLALGMAAMSEAACLLLDEPSAGLAESVRELVFETVRSIAQQGSTLLIAEQSDRWLRGLVGRTYQLEVGRMTVDDGHPVTVERPGSPPSALPSGRRTR